MAGPSQPLPPRLSDLETFLATAGDSGVVDGFLARFPLTCIVAGLVTHDERLIDATVRTVDVLLSGEPGLPMLMSESMRGFYSMGLGHGHPRVRQLTCHHLGRLLHRGGVALASHVELLHSLVARLADSSLSVAEEASRALVLIGSSLNTRTALFSHDLQTQLRELSSHDDIVRFRVLALMCQVACSSPEALALCNEASIVEWVMETLDSHDILLQLNTLEALAQIAHTAEGLVLLHRSGAVARITALVAESQESEPLLSNTALRLLGELALQHECSGIQGSLVQDLLHQVLQKWEEQDPMAQEAALAALGTVAISASGTERVLADEAFFKGLVECATQSVWPSVRLAALHTLSHLLQHAYPPDSSSSHRLESLLFSIASDPIEFLMSHVKGVIHDMKLASYSVLNATARHEWGIRAMASHPGFFEYLIGRHVESTKIGKEWKFALAGTITQNQHVEDAFGRERARILATYVRQGPFYVRGESRAEISSKSS